MMLKYCGDDWSERQDWFQSTTSHCTTMWDTEYHHLPGLCDVSSSQSTTIGAIAMPPPPESAIPQCRRERARLTMEIADSDHMQRFQWTPQAEDVTDLIDSWAKRLNSPQLSQLAHMVHTIHSIPAISSAVERVLSTSMLLISDSCKCVGDA